MEGEINMIEWFADKERCGVLVSDVNSSHTELEFPEKTSETAVDKDNIDMPEEDFDHTEPSLESLQDSDFLEDDSVNEQELLFQGTSDLILYLDKFGRITKINRAGLSFSGFSEGEIIGKSFWRIPGVFSRKNVSSFLKVFKNSLMGKNTEGFVATVTDKTGRTHIMDFSTYPIIKKGKIGSILVIAKDITDLKETEDKYRLITENTSDLIALATFSLNPKYTYLSPSTEKMMGYKPEELVGRPCFDIIHPDDKKKMLSIARKYIGSNGKKLFTGEGSEISENIEFRMFDKKGKLHYIKSTVNSMGDEILFVSRDITKEKEIEEKLRASEERFRTIVSNIPGAIYRCANDEECTMEYISSEVDKISGYPASGFINNADRSYASIIHPDDQKQVNKTIQMGIANKQPYVMEYRIIHKDGSIKWVYEKGNGVFDDTGKVLWRDGAIFDITERKNAEMELQKAHEELKELNRDLERKVEERTKQLQQVLAQKDEFINQLGHDLKNPLGPLVSLVPLLEKRESDPRYKEMLTVINRNVGYMRNLVTKTLELARLNSPNTKFDFKEMNLSDAVKNVIDANQFMFQETHIEVINNIPDNIILNADYLRMEELFNNLLTNAVKYSNDAGTVVIDVVDQPDTVTVSIKDSGIGITAEQLDHVFDEFYKADGSRHDFDSSGLGMPICKRIVEKHGGRIWAESDGLGKGSTFYFTIPKNHVDVQEENAEMVNNDDRDIYNKLDVLLK